MITLGFDPGFDRLGWAVGEIAASKLALIKYGCLETDPRAPLIDRLKNLNNFVASLIETHHPDELAMESLFFNKNVSSAMMVSQVRGMILSQCLAADMKTVDYTPSQIKLAVTGDGRATKKAMAKMVELQTQVEVEKLKDDAVDAIGVLITHAAIRKLAILTP